MADLTETRKKKSYTIRLSETTLNDIASIAETKKCSQADVINVLIHAYVKGYEKKEIEDAFELMGK